MKSLILSLLLFSLTAQAKKIIDLNIDSGIIDWFSDQVFINRELVPIRQEDKKSKTALFFKNNQCEIWGTSIWFYRNLLGHYNLNRKGVHRALTGEWIVDLGFNYGKRHGQLLCKFPSNAFKSASDITTDHIISGTNGILTIE